MNSLFRKKTAAGIEVLEQRIAPAALVDVQPGKINDSILLDADPSTSAPAGLTLGGNGAYLIYVTKGQARVFTQDLNGNGLLDFDEITGIAAGDGLRLISFVDIHGDIVTNLNPDGTLTDSDGMAVNGRDGQILLNNRIESIELRSVTAEEIPGGQILSDRIALSSYSIFGNIYAGGGFGAADGGLRIDTTGAALQQTAFDGSPNIQYVQTIPEIGSIRVGTAASGQSFSFGASDRDDARGELRPFVPARGAAGADIINVGAANLTMKFNLGTLQAGDGGYNGRGGDIINPVISGDGAGGYSLIAGNGGNGPTGPRGGNIVGWSDGGTIGSEVYVKTGDGGVGIVGRGGDGGVLRFGDNITASPVNIAGHVRIELGDGGNGLTGGGHGGSQPDGQFSTPDPAIPFGVDFVTSWHKPGGIGQLEIGTLVLQGFDFDLDGNNDLIYSSAQTDIADGQGEPRGSQLVVLFGTGNGGWDPSRTMWLDSPSNAAVTVGDFNGDGRADIAAASGAGSHAGIKVFMSRYDGNGSFTGFSDARYSALPSLGQGTSVAHDPQNHSQVARAYQVFEIASADLNGDGAVDLVLQTNQGVIYMRGDLDGSPSNPSAENSSGYFYADYRPNGLTTSGSYRLPVDAFTGTAASSLKATALKDGDLSSDVVISAQDGLEFLLIWGATSGGAFTKNTPLLGQVDTDRGANISLQDALARDVAITDINGDGNADLFVITSAPQGFLVTLQGNGTGGFTIGSGDGVNNAGILLSTTNTPVGITAIHLDPADMTGASTQIAVNFHAENTTIAVVYDPVPTFAAVTVVESSAGFPFSPDDTVRAFDAFIPRASNVNAQTLGEVYPVKSNDTFDQVLTYVFNGVGGAFGSIENNSWFFTAGDGGDAISGKAGNGGSIGKTLSLESGTGRLVGSFDIVLPTVASYEGFVRIIAGTGGNGFTGGGAGGSITGVSVSYADGTQVLSSGVQLFAGDGGDSVRGTGGAGGRLAAMSIESGTVFVAGDGGSGRIGGRGGSVVGNPFGLDSSIGFIPSAFSPPAGDLENTKDAFAVVAGGNGGAGLVAGGDGGGISGFTPRFLQFTEGTGGLLHYEAGQGGDSLRGKGGRGGSVVDSSPVQTNNFLAGDIFVRAGDGGNGRSGGAGGSVSDFVNFSTKDISPDSFTIIAGNGGRGVAGAGGAGGGVFRVDVSGTGRGSQNFFDFSDPTGIAIDDIDLPYSRIAAGAGGDSIGSVGGVGGSVVNVNALASATSVAVAAGRGGDGLQRGGNGGSVLNAEVNSAAEDGGFLPDAQTLIVAGEGGDAYAGPRRSSDVFAPGGRNPVGGNGGSIVNFTQSVGEGVNVQLIAGNGGDLINAGSTRNLKSPVGKGGSITNVFVAGSIGNAGDPNDIDIAIKAYNPLYDGNALNDDMGDFVRNRIVGAPGDTTFVLTNLTSSVGNVGIVVGAKGRIQDVNQDGILDPAPDVSGSVPNGSLLNVRAQHIMSAVAGHVERIASIQVLRDVRVTIDGGEYGSDKRVEADATPTTSVDGHLYTAGPTPGSLDYLRADGTFSTPVGSTIGTPIIGGRLVDGAIIAKTTRAPLSDRDFKLA